MISAMPLKEARPYHGDSVIAYQIRFSRFSRPQRKGCFVSDWEEVQLGPIRHDGKVEDAMTRGLLAATAPWFVASKACSPNLGAVWRCFSNCKGYHEKPIRYGRYGAMGILRDLGP